VFDEKTGTTQTIRIVDITITITTINASAIIVLIPFRERRREDGITAINYMIFVRQKEPVTIATVLAEQLDKRNDAYANILLSSISNTRLLIATTESQICLTPFPEARCSCPVPCSGELVSQLRPFATLFWAFDPA
jgi:hypothetical protein